MSNVAGVADKLFTGSIAGIYDAFLVPLIFEPYARDLSQRLVRRSIGNVLEIAAGTGVVTRELASRLPPSIAIVATDLNEPMLERASSIGTSRAVEWRQADAMQLPFASASFDAVVCQFGVMFFPDKARAFAEARRVLRAGGVFIFSVWDRLAENEFAQEVTDALAELFPANQPRFMERVPHGYHDAEPIARDLESGGFAKRPDMALVAARSRAESARIAAIAYCQGTPLRNEIEARNGLLAEVTDVVTGRLARRFGSASVDGKIQALVVSVDG